jgi:hypothetical protein
MSKTLQIINKHYPNKTLRGIAENLNGHLPGLSFNRETVRLWKAGRIRPQAVEMWALGQVAPEGSAAKLFGAEMYRELTEGAAREAK